RGHVESAGTHPEYRQRPIRSAGCVPFGRGTDKLLANDRGHKMTGIGRVIEDQEDRLGQRVSSPHSGEDRFWVAGKQYLGQLSPCSRSAGRQNRAVCNERHHYLYHGEPARPPFLAYLDRNWFWNDCCARDSGTPRRSI